MRIGYGWDSHSFRRGVPLKLGGVTIAHPKGLSGHSDGDVLLHALTDALLGAIAAGDIGTHFPPSDKRWKGADSQLFVAEAMRRVRKAGYQVANVDSTLILASPRIGPHAGRIRRRLAKLVGVSLGQVSVKAKTPEGLGMGNAAIAQVCVLLLGQAKGTKLKERAEHAPTAEDIDDVVEQILRKSQALETEKPIKGKRS